jgi:hypothetical protein
LFTQGTLTPYLLAGLEEVVGSSPSPNFGYALLPIWFQALFLVKILFLTEPSRWEILLFN